MQLILGFVMRFSTLHPNWQHFIRPRDIVCRRTYILPGILLSFFRRLISELAERNSTKIGHILGSNCNLKTHVEYLRYHLPYKSGAQKQPFWTNSQHLTATLTAYIFWAEHDIDNRSSALTTTRGFLHRPKMWWTLVNKQLQTGPPFLPTLCKFCFLRHCKVSQTEINKQNSTKLCQTADGKSP